MDPEPRSESDAVYAALTAWRRKATDIVLAVVSIANLPVLVMGITGHGPPMASLLKEMGIAGYLLLVAAALFRRIDYRYRLFVSFVALYAVLALTNLAFPGGPYAHAGIVTLPIFALVLLGESAGLVAMLASTAVALSTPFLSTYPGLVQFSGIDPEQSIEPPDLFWFRAMVRVATLLVLMILLHRFHRFLVTTLNQGVAAQRKMEREMRERKRLEREIAMIADREQHRLGQELHDGVCQQMAGALMCCQALGRRSERGEQLSSADFKSLSFLLAETVVDTHNIARGLCALDSGPDALALALQELTRRTQEMAAPRCEFIAAGEVGVADPAAARHLYRIAQEALSNAVRHAHASRIKISLQGGPGELILSVEDDGKGLPADFSTNGMGLRTMAYRAEVMQGQFTVERLERGGTRVVCRLPTMSINAPATDKCGGQLWVPAA